MLLGAWSLFPSPGLKATSTGSRANWTRLNLTMTGMSPHWGSYDCSNISNDFRLAMDLEKNNSLNARQKEEYNKLTNDFNGLQVGKSSFKNLSYLFFSGHVRQNSNWTCQDKGGGSKAEGRLWTISVWSWDVPREVWQVPGETCLSNKNPLLSNLALKQTPC